MGRAPCCDKANVKKGPWAPEEDAKLKAYIEKYGTGGNWIALPQKVGLKRCGKSCRLRWLNYLRPNIKHGGFTDEEDNIICSLYISIGSRWSIIAAQLPGRTDNDIKNYWNTRLKKKLLGRRKQNRLSISGQEPKEVNGDDNSYNLQNMSSSALERLQLHMHLQTLQNPLSFYNNPALWPKINPIQHKMIQTLHSMNENQNINLMNQISSSPQPEVPLALDHQEYSPLSNLKKIDEVENCVNGFSSLKADQSNVLESGFTQAELDDLLNNNKSCNFLPSESQIGELDCFKEMDGSKDNLGWWSNEFDAHSASSSSWDSENMLHRSEGMYQDYGLGYSMQ